MATQLKTRSTHRSTRAPEPLAMRLRRLAHECGPNAKLPTARDLCKELNTNQAALNIALRDLEANSLIYRKHAVGIFVSPKIHTKSIAVLYDTSVADQPGLSPFWGMLWATLIKEAQKQSEANEQEFTFRMMTSHMHPDSLIPPDLMRMINDGLVHGAMGIGLSEDMAKVAAAKKIPLVAFAGSGYWHVEFNSELEVREALNVLVDRGCRTIGLWRTSFPYEYIPIYRGEMLAAFKDQLQLRKVPFYPELVRDYWDVPMGQFRGTHQQQGYRLTMETFGPNSIRRPDGLIILDDMMTSGALFAFKKLNLEHEETVKIATVANAGSTVLFGHEESLILIEHDPREVALAMLRALDKMMGGRQLTDDDKFVLPKIRLPEQYTGVLHGLA